MITPNTLIVNGFTPTTTGFVATFDRPLATAQLNLYNALFGGLGAADLTVVNSFGSNIQGSLLVEQYVTEPVSQHTATYCELLSWTAGQLDRAGCPVVLLTGNHGTLHAGSVPQVPPGRRCAG